jgi:ribosome-associated protein
VIRITDTLWLPDTEVEYRTSRSGGPGGQNVNKVSTRVTLLFDLAGSGTLTEEQRRSISERLGSRTNKDGVLRVVSQRHRTQLANREAATERFARLMAEALAETPERRPATVSEGAKERRLEEKHLRARIKRERAKDIEADD